MSEKLITNVSVACCYAQANFQCESVSSSYLGEELTVLERDRHWVKARQMDDYSGWFDSAFLVQKRSDWDDRPHYASNDLVTFIHENSDSGSTTFRDMTLLSELPLVARTDGWVQLLLPDGMLGWVPDHPRERIEHADAETLSSTAMRFLGIQYFWGGKTPKGFDCSGYVQTVFALNGISLPRDSCMQAECGQPLGETWQDWQTGDLLFFSSTGKPVTHVALALGDGDFIHCSGFVRINSLNPAHKDLFSEKLDRQFVKAKRIL